jgi:proteic killer suppression protein
MGEKRSIQTASRTNRKNQAHSLLNTAKSLDPLRMIPGYRPHSLSGDMKGFWAIWVTGNYRICFKFEDGSAYEINYLDYH